MSSSDDPTAQSGFQARLLWGRRGARQAAADGAVVVVVDVLSFSSAVAAALGAGATVFPARDAEEGAALAARHGAELAASREAVRAGQARYSLSPATLAAAPAGARIVLPSPNGATCCRLAAAGAAAVSVGSLRNATATARVAAARAAAAARPLAVLACGERWREPCADDGGLRFALEDLLGAGAILAALPATASRSPEAAAAIGAFLAARGDLEGALRECGSGRELVARDHPDDVAQAARLDATEAGAFLDADALVRV